MARREEVLVGVLAEQVEVVGRGDAGWRIVVEQVGERGECLRGLKWPRWAVPLALAEAGGFVVAILDEVSRIGWLDGAQSLRAGELRDGEDVLPGVTVGGAAGRLFGREVV